MIQQAYQAVVDDVTDRCVQYFNARLRAVYLTGSVYRGEAVAGESDLDYWCIVDGEISPQDRRWQSETRQFIEAAHSILNGAHINLYSMEDLRRDKFARFALKYNAALWHGGDVIDSIEREGCEVFLPDRHMAKGRLQFARRCFAQAMAGQCPDCLDAVPENTYMAARKFARYFVVVEGAYFLMAKGCFESFAQDRVIDGLKIHCAGFEAPRKWAQAVLSDPIGTGIGHEDFLARISELVNWMFDEISRS